MMKFEKGQKVVCVDDSGVENYKLEEGKVYTVLAENDRGFVWLEGENAGYYNHRFVLKKEEEEVKQPHVCGYQMKLSSRYAIDFWKIREEAVARDNPVVHVMAEGHTYILVDTDLIMSAFYRADINADALERELWELGANTDRPVPVKNLQRVVEIVRIIKNAKWKGKECVVKVRPISL